MTDPFFALPRPQTDEEKVDHVRVAVSSILAAALEQGDIITRDPAVALTIYASTVAVVRFAFCEDEFRASFAEEMHRAHLAPFSPN